MSTIKSSNEDITINADGSGRSVKFQANGVEVASIDSTGALTTTGFTSTGIDDNATSTAITIDASENVGIGTSSPTELLSVGNTSTQYTRMQFYAATNGASTIHFGDGTAGGDNYRGYLNYAHDSNSMQFATDATERMRIDSAGAVGIGTSAPASTFKVHIKGSTPNLKTLKSEVISTGDVSHFFFDNPNGTVGSIGTSGTATAYYTSSDYRLKENIVAMPNSIDRLKTLKPVRFNFITDATKSVDGFLAHEAQSVVPECVKGVKDEMMDEEYEVTPAVMDGDTIVTEAVMGTRSVPDYQGIDQSKLVPLLVASLQEAVAKIEALEARVTALEV